MILGIDASTYFEEKAVGNKYFIDGKEVDPLQAFINQGVNYLRIRVWNNPYDENGNSFGAGTCDIPNFIRLAKHAVSIGYHILLDIHYSDFWADPNKQICPRAWKGLTFEEVEEKVYEFTIKVLSEAKKENIPIELIQIGNEITNGMIWPYGRLDLNQNPRGNYDKLARLIKAGTKAAKEVYPNIRFIIHLERSYDTEVYDEFFTMMDKYDVYYDIIGMSYYPYWHKKFADLFKTVKLCQEKFHREIMIMEVSYGFTLDDYMPELEKEEHMVINHQNIKDVQDNIEYPISEIGQRDFIKDLIKKCKEHNISGIFYWEPMWTPHGKDLLWASEEAQTYIVDKPFKGIRNEWSNQCLFDYNGNALPAFKEYKN